MNLDYEFETINNSIHELTEMLANQASHLKSVIHSTTAQSGSEKGYFSVKEAAKYLGISETAFKDVAAKQKLPTRRFGEVRKNLYKKEDIDRLVEIRFDRVN